MKDLNSYLFSDFNRFLEQKSRGRDDFSIAKSIVNKKRESHFLTLEVISLERIDQNIKAISHFLEKAIPVIEAGWVDVDLSKLSVLDQLDEHRYTLEVPVVKNGKLINGIWIDISGTLCNENVVCSMPDIERYYPSIKQAVKEVKAYSRCTNEIKIRRYKDKITFKDNEGNFEGKVFKNGFPTNIHTSKGFLILRGHMVSFTTVEKSYGESFSSEDMLDKAIQYIIEQGVSICNYPF